MRKLNITLLVVVMFALMLTPAMADTVIGKVHIKKGTEVAVFVPVGNTGTHMPFIGTAFKDQTFYILQKIKDDEGFVYKADGQGFSHDCPAHGEEIFTEQIFIVFLEEDIDGDKIKVEMFEEK